MNKTYIKKHLQMFITANQKKSIPENNTSMIDVFFLSGNLLVLI
ncbi:MAG: hypothetical protein P8X79_01210 [Reinekea sp.]